MSNENKQSSIIPWEHAQQFAEHYGQDFIVVLLWSEKTDLETVLTWGKTMSQSEGAAAFGNHLKEHLGWDPEQRKAVSTKVQNLLNAYTDMEKSVRGLMSAITENDFEGHPDIYDNMRSLEQVLGNLKRAKEVNNA